MDQVFQPTHLILYSIVLMVVFLICRILWRLGSKLR
jgi:hypothetical protein